MKSTRILSSGKHGAELEPVTSAAPLRKEEWSANRVRSRLPQPVLLFGQYPSEKAGSSDRLHASRHRLSNEEGEQSALYDVPAESEVCGDRCGEMGEALRRSIFTKWRRAGGAQTGATGQNAVFAGRSCGQGNGHCRRG